MENSETCLFCLEDIKSQESVINPIGCHCILKSHKSCLVKWFEQKNQYECPICHAVSIPNVVHTPTYTPFQVVVVRDTHNTLDEIHPSHQKCIAWCCIGVIGWTILANILNLALHT